jgi:Flp pilus assembly protein TadG
MIQSQAQSSRRFRHRGVTLIYAVVMMTTLCAFTSLAVDFGRVQLCKNELRYAADAAARAGAGGLATNPATAQALAVQYAAINTADGTPVALDLTQGDVQLGSWVVDPTGKVAPHFVALTGNAVINANAVCVTAHRSAARGTALPLMFAKVLGFYSCDVSAQSIAEYIPGVNVDQTIQATANPFLAGMPQGSKASIVNPANDPDVAGDTTDPNANPLQSPIALGMSITGGASLNFDTISGSARHDPNLSDYEPDGDLNDIGHNNLTTNYNTSYIAGQYYNENGIADMTCPIDAIVGVFLDDNAPTATNAPAQNLDYSTAAARNQSTFAPQLKQMFFIGDGLDGNGKQQTFVAPPGATRLFLATWDYYQWSNNSGFSTVKINRLPRIITVE